MENNNSGYIISGGLQGKSRLNVLSDALYPYTKSLLADEGLKNGMSFLDVGCGGGNVSLLASEMVGGHGVVKGIDFDSDIIALAARDAASGNILNTSFEAGSAYDISYDSEFDIAYARFLFSHLEQPADVLAKMGKSVKSGGKVIVEDTHFCGHFCYPHCDAFDQYVAYFMKAAYNNGHNPNIGPELFMMFRESGFTDIHFDTIIPCYNDGPGKWMAYLTLDRIKSTLLAQNIDSEANINAMLSALKLFSEDSSTIMSLPHIFRISGTKR